MSISGSTPLPGRLRRRLEALLGPENVIADPARLLAYESDALTTLSGTPRAALFPRSRDELRSALSLLASEGLEVVPRGSGTGLSGGAVPRDQVLLVTVKMNRILEIDPVDRTAEVEPGVITDDINAAAAEHGLRYLPDPSSASNSTIGGNVAENAGGPHCLRDGVTTDHVLGLELLSAEGEPVWLDRGEDGGLDLGGAVVGSEGTLGVVSRIRVRLYPRPAAVRTLLAAFDSVGDAGEAVTRIIAEGLVPAALELVDRNSIRVVEESGFATGLPEGTNAALIVESEGFPEEVEAEIAAVEEVLRASGAAAVEVAEDEVRRQQLWQARKKAYGALGRMAPDILVQDAAVPRSALPDLLPRIEDVAARHGVTLANFFHAGDGNLHPNLLFDRRDRAQVERVEEASAEIMQLCVEAGGTITGEHGVGLDKKDYMRLIFTPDELEALRRVKRAFDPGGRSNPDKMLP